MLQRFQGLLETIYDVQTGYTVTDFLITNAALAAALQGSAARPVEEKLLIARDGDDAGVSLYVEEALLARLRKQDPLQALSDDNLADFLIALEGVSHFVYLAWNLRHDRPVTRLDLELQAEVDKYIAALFLLLRQRGGRMPARLHERLFRDFRFHPDLDALALRCYRRANDYAARYCTRLERDYLRSLPRSGLLRELRRFYRLAYGHKLSHIDKARV